MADLLLELFSEEIPARMQNDAAEALKKLMTNGLVEAGLTYGSAAAFATPRRLTLTVEGLLERSPELREERKGPRTDAPEKALEGFLRSTGLTKDQLEVRDDKKGQVYFASIVKEGRDAPEIIAETLETTIRNFPWPKSMRWGTGSLRWVRPLHSILCILSGEEGAEVVPFEIDGIIAGNITRGHRFMAPDAFSVTNFEDYEAKLKRAHVLLRADDRAERIRAEAENLAFAQGGELVEDRGLLTEVAGLVEWPVPLIGKIEDRFLTLPPEVLQTSMKEHQKFFSVKKGGQITHYITVANRETSDGGATILAGNAKVLAARLSDALFFWENDLRVAKAGMGDWLKKLENVTFHNKLGTQAARIARIAALAEEIAPLVGADPAEARRAAEIAKADLSSEMVYEFPELQGLMGRYYAEQAGETPDVAAAAEGHYAPLGPNDAVPTAPVTIAVALADKIDLLTGFWAIDEKPTGSKDPFALRRAALGAIRTVLGNDINVELSDVLLRHIATNFGSMKTHQDIGDSDLADAKAELDMLSKYNLLSEGGLQRFKEMQQSVDEGRMQQVIDALVEDRDRTTDLLAFIADRLKVHLKSEGIRHDVIDACFALDGQDDLVLLTARARALQALVDSENGENLLQGYRRAVNILTAEEKKDGVEYSLAPESKLFENDAEKALFAALQKAEADLKPILANADFAAAMEVLASLRAPIDQFFEDTQVNAPVEAVRRNRLCLLNEIRDVMHRVAMFGKLEG
ncbi:glycine--tRNA ligase subunit beta [Paracoccaceae bacterium GXU_MW_L88]